MAKVRIDTDKIRKELIAQNVDPQVINKVDQTISANVLPESVYRSAVLYLGFATILLVVGGVLLVAICRQTPEALWAALGAGIGGLAGIFTGNK
jgi:hypothetical protein